MVIVNNMIKDYRRKVKMTQLELAQRLGIKEKTVCYWETGRSMIFPRKSGHKEELVLA